MAATVNKQTGFIALPVMAWAAIGASVVILALGVAVKVQTSRLEVAKQEFATFKAEVKVLGDAQNEKTRLQDIENRKTEAAAKLRKDKSDAENQRVKANLAGVYAAYRSLRDGNSGSGKLPNSAGAATFAPSAARSCFDSPEFIGAIRSLETGILGITQQGDQAIVDLNTARKWAQDK